MFELPTPAMQVSKTLENSKSGLETISINAMRQGRESRGDPRGGATAPPEFLRRQGSQGQNQDQGRPKKQLKKDMILIMII